MSLLDILYEEGVRLLAHEFTADQLADPSERQTVHNILVAKIPALRAAGPQLVGFSRTPPPPGDDLLWYQAVLRPRVERIMDAKIHAAGQRQPRPGAISLAPPQAGARLAGSARPGADGQGQGTVLPDGEGGATAARPRERRRATPAARDKLLEARDRWIYRECCKGTPHDQIVAALKQQAGRKGWQIFSSKQRVQQIGNSYADRHSLPRPPARRSQ
jgi:hypothetical protein